MRAVSRQNNKNVLTQGTLRSRALLECVVLFCLGESFGMTGGRPRLPDSKDLAGAVGLEPTPSSLTVRCPTDWTTPQRVEDVLSKSLKDNRCPQNAQARLENFIPLIPWGSPLRSRSASRRPWKCSWRIPFSEGYPRRGRNGNLLRNRGSASWTCRGPRFRCHAR